MSLSTTKLYHLLKAKGEPVTCHWCDTDLVAPTAEPIDRRATRDHINPKGETSRGRSVVLACLACNQVKGNMQLMTWLSFMQSTPSFRSQFRPHRPKVTNQDSQLMNADDEGLTTA